jgi:hypothetical protein
MDSSLTHVNFGSLHTTDYSKVLIIFEKMPKVTNIEQKVLEVLLIPGIHRTRVQT